MKRIKTKTKKRVRKSQQEYNFKPGTEAWKLRDPENMKGPRVYKSIKDLTKACLGYFAWADASPLYEEKVAGSYLGEVMMVSIPRKRVYTYMALFLHINISHVTWYNWKNKQHASYRPDLQHLISSIEQIIKTQKFEGAASGFFKEGLIIRDLGLTDKQDMTSGGMPMNSSTSIVVNNDMNVKEAEKAYKQMLLGE